MRNVGDLRRLAQKLQEFDAAQLDVRCVELRQRSELELLLDRAHVLLDTRGRGDRFFVLQACERRLAVLVGEVEARSARHQQGTGHQRQDEREVFAK